MSKALSETSAATSDASRPPAAETVVRFQDDILGLPAWSALREVLDGLPHAVLWVDTSGIVLHANTAAGELLGCPTGQMRGARLSTLCFCRQDPAIPVFLERLRRERRIAGLKARVLDADGKASIPVDLTWQLFERDGFEVALAFCKATAAAQALTVEQFEFLSSLSHEIRTPLQGVTGMADLLLATPLTREQQEIASMIRSSAGMLTHVIGDICDFANLKAGRMELRREAFDLHDLLEEVGQSLAPMAEENHVRLIFQYRPSDARRRFVGDPDRLRQLIRHLASHSLDTTRNGRILLRVEVRQPESGPGSSVAALRCRVRISVIDSGPGIDKILLNRFSTELAGENAPGSAMTSGRGGFPETHWTIGLGLPIAQALARLMGGTLSVANNVGRGATFRADLALPPDLGALKTPPHRQSLAGRRALLVDTDREERLTLRSVLERYGCVVEEAAGGAEASMRLRVCESLPDVVVVDYNLGRIDGTLLIRGIKEDPDLQFLPVVGIATAGQLGEYRALPEGWVSLLLSKPILEANAIHGISAALPPRTVDWEHAQFPVPAPSADGTRPGASTARVLLSDLEDAEKRLIKVSAEKAPRILLVEKHPVSRRVLRRLLDGFGYSVEVVGNGTEALKYLHGQPPDLVLAALDVDDFSRLHQYLERVAGEDGQSPRVRLVGLTAVVPEGASQPHDDLRLDACLPKPVEPLSLRDTINRLIR